MGLVYNPTSFAGGSGGFTSCNITVTSAQVMTLIVAGGGSCGGYGQSSSGGYGGGDVGHGSDPNTAIGGGGGRSAIQLVNGVDAVTAGGGGGGGAYGSRYVASISGGLCGGGLIGCTADASGVTWQGGSGSQTAGGTAGACCTSCNCAFTATVGSQYGGGDGGLVGGGGGGGYYGGGGGGDSLGNVHGGGGGSGYIGGCDTGTGVTLQGNSGTTAAATLPAGTSDASYVSGVGIGGAGKTDGTVPGAGGNGMIVIHFFYTGIE